VVPGYRAGVNACLHLTRTIMPDSGEVKAMHTSRCASWASDHFPKEPLIGYERTLSARANGVWIPTSPQQQKKGLAHRRRTNAQIRDPSSARWR
jgi:hypothetical protein